MKTAIYKFYGKDIWLGSTVIVINSSLNRAINQINDILEENSLPRDACESNVEKVEIVSGKEVYVDNGDY